MFLVPPDRSLTPDEYMAGLQRIDAWLLDTVDDTDRLPRGAGLDHPQPTNPRRHSSWAAGVPSWLTDEKSAGPLRTDPTLNNQPNREGKL